MTADPNDAPAERGREKYREIRGKRDRSEINKRQRDKSKERRSDEEKTRRERQRKKWKVEFKGNYCLDYKIVSTVL